LAFLDAKKDEAHRVLLDHLAAQLNLPRRELLSQVGEAPLPRYVHQTRTVLSALAYYKRFAVSILHVDSTDEAETVVTP
jgi:CRISPR-associated protein Cmr5